MTDNVQVTPGELRSAADDLKDVAGEVQRVLNTLAAARHAHWGAWGDDDFGSSFSGGNGYIASDANLDDAVGSKVQLLQSYAGGLRDAATRFEEMESGNTDSFRA
ncbi:hypothetical protein K7711_30750 [Nocardia sp. CA2R105]|uniref:WXG100 family type VII secretion target n=1 Tax=Nocardia coffeae TaxID=2873381 RepID=UPI001CA71FE0|nr:type VII secretion target [Nocardia coffeae]MBY8860890.1 hypothetical protein [Nocardia coffeae]